MDRFVEAGHFADGSRRHHADGTAEDGRFVAEDVAEEVARDDDVELFRIEGQLHGAVIDVEMIQVDIGIVLGDVDDRAAPQAGRSQDVGLVDGRDLMTALLSRFHGKRADALYFRNTVVFQVPSAFDAVVDFRFAAIAEVDAADEFADDEDVRAGDDVRFERRIFSQHFRHLDWTQVDVKSQSLAKAQDSLFGPQFRVDVIPLVAADGAEEDGIGLLSRFNRIFRQRRAAEIIGRTASRFLFKSQANVADFIDFL